MTRIFFGGFSWMRWEKNADGKNGNVYKKLGAFYVEFIFHAWVARDFSFSSSPSPFAFFFGWLLRENSIPALSEIVISFFFLDLFFEKKSTIEFFLLPKCPPPSARITNAFLFILQPLYLSLLFNEDKKGKKKNPFLVFFSRCIFIKKLWEWRELQSLEDIKRLGGLWWDLWKRWKWRKMKKLRNCVQRAFSAFSFSFSSFLF